MMATPVWKQCLRVGDFYCDAGNGRSQIFSVSEKDLHHFANTGREMVRCGLSIPISLEHGQGLRPMSEADMAADRLRNAAGFVGDFDVRGQSLWSRLDISDDQILKKLPSIKYVSPEILPSMTDGRGKSWSRFVSHIALTTCPVDRDQEPFSLSLPVRWFDWPVPARLSLGSVVRQPVRLAAAPQETPAMREMDGELAYYLRLDQNKLTHAEIQSILDSQFANR